MDSAPRVFVITLTYIRPLEEIDEARQAHLEHLRRAFASGLFLMAGPQVPRTGGVIIARGDRDAVDAHMAADPFVTLGLAEVLVTEFAATTTAACRSARYVQADSEEAAVKLLDSLESGQSSPGNGIGMSLQRGLRSGAQRLKSAAHRLGLVPRRPDPVMVFLVFEEDEDVPETRADRYRLRAVRGTEEEADAAQSRLEAEETRGPLCMYGLQIHDVDRPLQQGDVLHAIWEGAETEAESREPRDPAPSLIYADESEADEVYARILGSEPREAPRRQRLTVGWTDSERPHPDSSDGGSGGLTAGLVAELG